MNPISEPAAPPKVSVLMLTHNHAQFINDAISSVYRQTIFSHTELLIGEDASSDATAGLIESLSQASLALLRALGLVGGNGSLLCQNPLLLMPLPT